MPAAVDRELQSYLNAGTASGAAGLLVFLVAHHIWILPIWIILPIGLPIALGAGGVVGWAYAELRSGLPARPWTAVVLLLLIAIVLAPALIVAEFRAPMFDLSGAGGAVLLISLWRAVVTFVLEFLVMATAGGVILGLLISRCVRAALAMGAGGFAFAVGPGHNIPFGGGTPAVPLEIAIMALVVVVSVVTLVELQLRLAERRVRTSP